MSASEKDIQNAILDWLHLMPGCQAWTNDNVGIWHPVKKVYLTRSSKHKRKGVSDILCCWRGRFLAIEVKKPGESPRSKETDFRYVIVPWVFLAEEIRYSKYIPEHIKDAIRVMAKFQKWIHGTEGYTDTMRSIRRCIEGKS